MAALVETFSGDTAQLEAAYRRIERENVNLRDKLTQVAGESRRTHRQSMTDAEGHGGAIAEVGKQLGSLVSVYGLVKAAITAVNTQIREQIQLQKDAAAAAGQLAPARADFLQNLGSVSPGEKAVAENAIRRAASKGYGRLEHLTRAYGALAAASPEYTTDERAGAFNVAAQYAPQSEQITSIAAGLADTSKLSHTTDSMINLGIMAKTAEKSRVEQVADVAAYTMPAAANIRAGQGDSESEALALPVAIGNRIIDKEGRVSGTAAQQLAQQLSDWTSAAAVRDRAIKQLDQQEKLGPYERRDEGFASQLAEFSAGHGIKATTTEAQISALKARPELQEQYFNEQAEALQGGSTRERLEKLWSNPALAKQFAADMHGETRPLGAMRELVLDQSSPVARFYREQAAGGIPAGAQAAAYGQRSIENVRSDPTIHQRQTELAIENSRDLILLEQHDKARTAAMRKGIEEVFRATGVTGFGNWLERMEFDASTGVLNKEPVEKLREMAVRRQSELLNPYDDTFIAGPLKGEVTRDEAGAGEQLGRLIKTLDEELKYLPTAKAAPRPSPRASPEAAEPVGSEPLFDVDYSYLLRKQTGARPSPAVSDQDLVAQARKVNAGLGEQSRPQRLFDFDDVQAERSQAGQLRRDADALDHAAGHTAKDDALAAEMRRLADLMERFIEGQQAALQQKQQQHVENKTTGRAGRARAAGRQATGREGA